MTTPSRDVLPPGQSPIRSFPVSHVDEPPSFDPRTWDLRIAGLVDRPLRVTWTEFRELPRVERESDFHCVEGFSRLRNRWEGVLLRDLLARAGARPEARFVRFFDGRLYDTTIDLETALQDDVLLADTHDGRTLEVVHGGPVRVVVPAHWAWKSCKWVRILELLERDAPGFWESRGHDARADPWSEERRAGSGASR